MKKLIVPLLIILIAACGPTKHLPPKDTTIIHYVDSIAWHDSTIITYLEKERYIDMVKPLDTLNLETSYAKATAYLDTSYRALRGSIENKPASVETVIKWKEKIVYRDSLITKEIPVEVITTKEVKHIPVTYWWLLGFSILCLLYFCVKIYLKFKV